MDIVFQSGEFYGLSQGLFSKILPLIGVVLGFGLYQLKDLYKDWSKFKNQVEFFRITLRQLIFQLDNELNLIRDARSQSEKKEFILIKTNHSVSLKTDRLFKTIPYNEITNIFSKHKFEKDAYLFFISFIDILDNYDSNVLDINKAIHQTFIQNLNNFNQTIGKIVDYINNLKDKVNRNHAEILLLNHWDEFVDAYYDDHLKNSLDLNEPYYKGEKILDPMFLYLFNNKLMPTFRELKNLILEAKGYLNKQDEFREMNINTYTDFENELTKVWTNFVSVHNILTDKEDEKIH